MVPIVDVQFRFVDFGSAATADLKKFDGLAANSTFVTEGRRSIDEKRFLA